MPLICELQCLPSLDGHPYLVEEEETYEPPEDPDSGAHFDVMRQCHVITCCLKGLSLEELGMRALERLPRDRAIDGIRAFNDMRLVSSANIPVNHPLHFLTAMICSHICGPSLRKAEWLAKLTLGCSLNRCAKASRVIDRTCSYGACVKVHLCFPRCGDSVAIALYLRQSSEV
jgi:hypothetical protein